MLFLHAEALLAAPPAEPTWQQPPSFAQDVIPVLTRFGCNQGACHGKGNGQNGFRLSLRGYAPDWDHRWLTRELSARRISLLEPDDSLILRKALGEAAHGGGRVFAAGSPVHRLLRDWIAAGAPGTLATEPAVSRVEAAPAHETLRPGETRALQVTAYYADGRARDVTWLAQFASNDEGLLEVSREGQVTARGPGETVVRISFQGQMAVAMFTMPRDAQPDPQLFAERRNFIDEHLFAKLAALRIEPSPAASDAEFLRRVFLDLTGTLPEPEEVREFLADPAPDRRAQVVERLLARPEFVDHWTLFLADLLQNRRERDHDVRGAKDVRAFHAWLRQEVAANRPWNELARALLTAQGTTAENPAVGYYVVTVGEAGEPARSEAVSAVAQTFLGSRIGCANCHNHPLERFTQDDYHHFAAFFSRMSIDRKESRIGPTTVWPASRQIVQLRRQRDEAEQKRDALPESDASGRAEAEKRLGDLARQIEQQLAQPVGVSQPRTGQFMAAQPLDRSAVAIAPGDDPRGRLVEWMVAPENEQFAGAMVNRLWKQFFGVGLVEPVDDLRATNPPSNPELWRALVKEFVGHGYDLKRLMRVMVNSRAYQLSSATRPGNATDARHYSHFYARRLPAETLLDALCQSTGVAESFPGYPRGVRAAQLPDPGVQSPFLASFGRSARVTACACERANDVTLPQLLELQGGEELPRKIAAAEGRLARLLQAEPDDARLAEALFLATIGRLPSDAERGATVAFLAKAGDRKIAFEELFLTLLNTKEFAFQH